MAIEIFTGTYHKQYLHELISSQLDMDRLDYLRRDSFYTGVTEGAINSERLLTMLNIANDHLVIDSKGIYSVEKFIVARRLMYWQVYLHKTVLSAEFMIVNILHRARNLARAGGDVFASTALKTFLYHSYGLEDFKNDKSILDTFAKLDDYDILASIKEWCNHKDVVLSTLSKMLIDRKLLKIRIQKEPFEPKEIELLRQKVKAFYGFKNDEENYFVIQDKISNHAYSKENAGIKLLFKDGSVQDLLQASDHFDIGLLTKPTVKHFVCFPKEVG